MGENLALLLRPSVSLEGGHPFCLQRCSGTVVSLNLNFLFSLTNSAKNWEMQKLFQEQISVVFLMGEKVKGSRHEKHMLSDKSNLPKPHGTNPPTA